MTALRNVYFILILLFLATGCTTAQESITITGVEGAPDVAVPVELDPQAAPNADTRSTVAFSTDSGEQIILQSTPALFHAEGSQLASTYVGILPGELSGGTYTISSPPSEDIFSFEEKDGRLTLLEGDTPVLAYNFGMQLPEGVPERYRRSSYVHPIWDLSGTIITDDFPEDHYHHRGLSWMWPRVKVGEQTYDLWHIQGVRQIFEEWLAREVGPVCATIGVRNSWQLTNGQKIMEERVWIRAFKATENGRAIDVRLTLEALEQPVQLLGQSNQNKGYGGLSFRFAPREETVIVTSEGLQESDSDHKHVPWADESGKFRGSERFSGVAIFQHEDNPDFPAAWTLRHYGFLGVAWPGNEGVTIRPGEPVTLRYRIWIHRGDAEEGNVSEAYEVFVNPPTVQVSG